VTAGQTQDLPVPAQRASTHARFSDHAVIRALALTHPFASPSAFATMNLYEAQWLAYVVPADASLPRARVRPRVNVERYSFIASDSHRLLVAGLPAHCERFCTSSPCIRLIREDRNHDAVMRIAAKLQAAGPFFRAVWKPWARLVAGEVCRQPAPAAGIA
jgi:hypothetical protein